MTSHGSLNAMDIILKNNTLMDTCTHKKHPGKAEQNIYIHSDQKRKKKSNCSSGLVGNNWLAVSPFQFINNCTQEL